LWTDPSTLVAEDFPAGSIFTLPRAAKDITELAAAIQSHADLDERIAAARLAYAAKHTWRVRVGSLLAEQPFAKARGG
jgi:hypothetical protein